ncbi:MAG TPA: PAS domain S-box protein [Mariprofundaceae bacterium]|nr:PAS domain S-box protein [Mariprofundaceae bacterium]
MKDGAPSELDAGRPWPLIAAIALITLLLAGMVSWTSLERRHISNVHTVALKAGEDSLFDLANFHRRLEEWVSGKSSTDPASLLMILDGIDQRLQRIHALADHTHAFRFHPVAELHAKIEAAREMLRQLSELARKLVANPTVSGFGSVNDEAFDALYTRLRITIQQVNILLDAERQAHVRFAGFLQDISIALILLAGICIVWLVLRYDQRRRRDFSDILDARAALHARDGMLAAIFGASPDLLMVLDGDGRIVDANASVQQLLGHSRGDLLASNFSDLFAAGPESDLPHQRLGSALAGEMQDFEAGIMDAQGVEHPVEVRLREMPGGLGGRHVVIMRDLSTLRNLESSLIREEQRYRNIFHQSPVAMWEEDFSAVKAWVDARRDSGVGDLEAYFREHPEDIRHCVGLVRVRDVNRAALRLYGTESREQLLGALEKTFVAGSYEDFGREVASLARGESLFEMQTQRQTLDGEVRDVLLNLTMVPAAEQPWGHVVVALTDVTRLRQAERERQDTQAKMLHVQRLESLGVLAGGIAHDFNNLLTAIMGNTSLARDYLPETSQAHEYLVRIENTSRRAADLCQQMLAYSGKGRFVIKPINLSELVEEMTHLLHVSIGKSIVLRLDLPKSLPPINADVAQVQQVVMNLVTNASEAIGDQSGAITIATGLIDVDAQYLNGLGAEERLAAGRYVYLEVSDTGCGMDESTRERIFDPFFTTKFTGRGLGMAAVLGIVRGHKGAIKVYSEPGKGSSFKVLFPCSDADKAIDMKATRAQKEPAWRGQGTVLVVDDEASIREIAAIALERAGFKVLMAADGVDGVEMFRQHHGEIVAVLLDMTMPRLGGEDAFTEMRQIDAAARVILTSGYNEQDATNRFAGKNLAGFIKKPYSPKTLVAKFREVLGEDTGKA